MTNLKLVTIDNSEIANPWDVSGNSVIANNFIESTLDALKEAKRAEKAIKAQITKLEDQIKAYMSGCDTLIGDDGVTLATWKEQITERFDSAKFKKEDSKLYNSYTVCSISKRFLVK